MDLNDKQLFWIITVFVIDNPEKDKFTVAYKIATL